jgi:alpha-D-ribose 1-methylphosphonate 5-triphosphate synthase subunit PhnG
MDINEIYCESRLENMIMLVECFEKIFTINVISEPGLCMSMIKANDNLEKQDFYLGEVLCSECEVGIGDKIGYALIMNDDPKRAYCIAVLKAVEKLSDKASNDLISEFVKSEWLFLSGEYDTMNSKIQKTKVDFNLMD